MADTKKFKTRPDKPSDEKKAKAREELEATATKQAEVSGRPRDEVLKDLKATTARRRFEIEFQPIPEGPFYRPKRLGEQKRVIINTLHPFYTKVYDASAETKAALEVLLLVLGEAELEAEGELESFYRSARVQWSERLHHALNELHPDDDMRDKASAVAEKMQMATEVDSRHGAERHERLAGVRASAPNARLRISTRLKRLVRYRWLRPASVTFARLLPILVEEQWFLF